MLIVTSRVILIFSFLFICISSYEQVPVFKNFTTSDGLPSDNVYSVTQDNKGFIWIATESGVCRFDGTTFKIFSSSPVLTDNSVIRTEKDDIGRIWFLTFTGKLFYYKDDTIFSSSNSELLKKINFKSSISFFQLDSKKNIWIGSMGSELIRISPSNEVEKFHHISIKYLWDDKNGILNAIGVSGVYQLKDTGFIFRAKNFTTRFAIVLPGDSVTLLNTYEGLKTFKYDSKITALKDFKKYNGTNVSAMYVDNNNNLWLSTLNGAIQFDNSITSTNHLHTYLENYCINSIFQDRQGNYWFSTFGNGVIIIPSLDIKSFDKQSGLIENNISSISMMDDSTIIVGLHGGGIQLVNQKKAKTNIKSLISTPSGSILKIINDKNGNTWILTDETLFKYRLGKFTPIKDSHHWYKTIFIDNEGTCWVGRGSGFDKVAGDKIVSVWSDMGTTNRVYSIAQAGQEDFFLGTDKGLYHYKDGKAEASEFNDSIFVHRIDALAFSFDSTLWVGTDSYGLIAFRNHKITRYSTTEKLLDNRCNTMLADSNKIYIGTDKGLNIVELINGAAHIFSYSAANGLINNHIHDIVKKDKYTFLLATDQGVIEFDIRKLSPPFTGSPYINEVTVNDNKTSFSKPLNLHYNENAISVDFGTINFNSDGNINYRYRLVGADSGWNYSSTHSVKFSYLRPGNYKFIVTTQNTDGSWNSKQASFSFFIQTPWWNTWWFRTIAALSIIIVITLVVRNRITVYKQKLNQQRALLESELKALRAQINPHFIFNSLNSIQDFIMMNQKEDAHLYLAKFATLMRNILAHSRSAKITLDEEIKSLQLYLELEAIGFNNQFTFHFIVDKQINPEEVQIPSMILQPYIENAILHGLAPVKNNGMITISFQIKDNLLVCMIEDNGVGRKKAAEKREQGIWKSQPSLGMLVTQERIDLISAYQNEKINLQITDLVNDENIGCGTRVTICFPLDN